jgi:hypothetical protein
MKARAQAAHEVGLLPQGRCRVAAATTSRSRLDAPWPPQPFALEPKVGITSFLDPTANIVDSPGGHANEQFNGSREAARRDMAPQRRFRDWDEGQDLWQAHEPSERDSGRNHFGDDGSEG